MRRELSIRPVAGIPGTTEYTEADLARIENEARGRSSLLLREKLGSAAAIDLLKDEIEEGDRRWTEYVQMSRGRWKSNGFELDVKGFTSDSWLDWIAANLDDELMHFSVHPEHYAWISTAKLGEDPSRGSHVIVEPVGDLMLRFYVHDHEWEGMEEYFDEAYPKRRGTQLAVRDGTIVGKSISQCRDTDDGYRFRFQVFKPAALPDVDVVSHLDHAVVEYIHYMERAAAATAR